MVLRAQLETGAEQMNNWVVTVTDHAGVYDYGPFKTRIAAQTWADNMAKQFYGRIVHVRRLGTINPNGEA